MEIAVNLTGVPGREWPTVEVILNDLVIFSGKLQGDKTVAATVIDGKNMLRIRHFDKNNDTQVDDNGNIIQDRHVLLRSIELNGLSFDLNYFSDHQIPFNTASGSAIITNYFGLDGVFDFEFEYPLWRWWGNMN